jgi:hypothetical protein
MPEVNIPGVGVVHFPYDMPPDQIAAQAQRLYAEAQGKEQPLTRERQPEGAPSALSAGHHPAIDRDLNMSPFSQALGEAGETVGRWSNDNLPALASIGAGLATGGSSIPVSMGIAALAGGAGAAGREGVRRAAGEGAPKTAEELGLDVAKEGVTSGLLAGVPRMAMGAARAAGPAIARNAPSLSTMVRSAAGTGVGAGAITANPLLALPSLAAGVVTSPRAIRGVGNIVSRIGNSPMLNTVAEKTGLGGNAARAGADAFRKALLDALGAEPSASTVP